MKVTKEGKIFNDKGLQLKTWLNNSGYECIKYRGKHYTIHRLVALEYCEGYERGLVINHKDGDKLNNNANNLEWVTQKENIQDMILRGTHTIKEAHEVAWKNHKRPTIVTFKDGSKKSYDSIKEAALDNDCSPNKATLVCQGKRRHHKGLIFSYDIV